MEQAIGVGVVLSPRDVSRDKAIEYAAGYRDLGADVLLDQQFYRPGFTNARLDTYPISRFRASVSELRNISDQDLAVLANELRIDSAAFRTTAVLAPAVMYEAGQPTIAKLNARLFSMARQVGNQLGVPTYATVVLARSATSSDETVRSVLAEATELSADAWYFAFEFEEERIPSSREAVRRCCAAGLTLACTGRPVLHAYAGPMGLLSFGCGVTGAGIGHSQNLWKFTRDRWEPPVTQGGGGDAPPRFFSAPLWGTVIYPDETQQMAAPFRNQILLHSPFSDAVRLNGDWPRWEANKHLVHILGSTFDQLAESTDARVNAAAAIARLDTAVTLHQRIRSAGLNLRDESNVYQANWKSAMEAVLEDNRADFDYLELLNS